MAIDFKNGWAPHRAGGHKMSHPMEVLKLLDLEKRIERAKETQRQVVDELLEHKICPVSKVVCEDANIHCLLYCERKRDP